MNNHVKTVKIRRRPKLFYAQLDKKLSDCLNAVGTVEPAKPKNSQVLQGMIDKSVQASLDRSELAKNKLAKMAKLDIKEVNDALSAVPKMQENINDVLLRDMSKEARLERKLARQWARKLIES